MVLKYRFKYIALVVFSVLFLCLAAYWFAQPIVLEEAPGTIDFLLA